jgi:hypothetical protein
MSANSDYIKAEHRCLLLWASMLKERKASERARAQARQRHLNKREELLESQRCAINELDTASQKVLSDAMELYATAEACANTSIQQAEELAVHVGVAAEWEWVVVELEQRLQEREELDGIKLSLELKVLATREFNLNSREAALEVKQKAL